MSHAHRVSQTREVVCTKAVTANSNVRGVLCTGSTEYVVLQCSSESYRS